MLDYRRLLLSPRGRVRRRLYWRATMIFLVVSFWPHIIPRVGVYVGAAFSLMAIYGFACLYTKRLHDLGRTGWWQLIGWGMAGASLCLAILTLALAASADLAAGIPHDPRRALDLATGFSILGVMACLGLHVLLGVLRGEAGANRFGPNPGRPFEAEIFD